MLCFDRIGYSQESDVNKTSKSKEWDICHYWYFLYKGLTRRLQQMSWFVNDVYEP